MPSHSSLRKGAVIRSIVLRSSIGFGLILAGCAFTPGPTESSAYSGGGGSHGPLGFAGNFGTGGGHAGNSGSSNPDANCAAVNQGATRLPPDILIVQDKSGSMDESADGTCKSSCGTKSKWTQVTAALNQGVRKNAQEA